MSDDIDRLMNELEKACRPLMEVRQGDRLFIVSIDREKHAIKREITVIMPWDEAIDWLSTVSLVPPDEYKKVVLGETTESYFRLGGAYPISVNRYGPLPILEESDGSVQVGDGFGNLGLRASVVLIADRVTSISKEIG
jgi:hypothetical protein